MPIPSFNQGRPDQSWRQNKKKYYIKRATAGHPAKKTKRLSYASPKRNNQPANFMVKAKKILLFGSLFLVVGGVISGLIFFAWVAHGVTDISKLTERVQPQSTKIYDRTGNNLLFEFYGNEQRTDINLNEIPDYVKWATISIEDKDYYNHGAISLWGIFRGVVLRVMMGKSPQGGSTLTQQFVKNAVLSNERTIIRKMKEWILAYRLEKTYTKDEILQFYFNEIPYGSTAYGVEAASQMYFGKSARDVNLAEAAILAALPQAPSKYSPYGPNQDLLFGRQQYILDLMVQQKYISQDQADAAKEYKIEFKPFATQIKAPHFVMYVKEMLSEKYGEKTVEQGGLKVITTLDLYKQEIAEQVIDEHAEKNETNWNASNAALVSLDPKTGQILAMVGSRDYFQRRYRWPGQYHDQSAPTGIFPEALGLPDRFYEGLHAQYHPL